MPSKKIFLVAAYLIAVILCYNFAETGFDPTHPCRKEMEEPNLGSCKNYFGSYYWNAEFLTCKQYLYEGCGHFKHFKTRAECEDECKNA